jgi:hypothetical protein
MAGGALDAIKEIAVRHAGKMFTGVDRAGDAVS